MTTRTKDHDIVIPQQCTFNRNIDGTLSAGTFSVTSRRDTLSVEAGGFDSSFAVKKNSSATGLVTGDLSVVNTRVDWLRGKISRAIKGPGTKHRAYSDDLGMHPGTGNEPPGHDAGAVDAVAQAKGLKRLYTRITQGRKLLGMAYVAEYGKSSQLMRQYAAGVGKAFKTASNGLERDLWRLERRLNNSALTSTSNKAARILDLASDHWLRLNFGLKPLIDDTEALVTSINSFNNESQRGARVYRVVGGHSAKNATVNGSPVTADSHTGWKQLLARSRETNVRYKYLAFDAAKREGWAGRDSLGLTPADVLPTLYELLPWSWALDYVSNTGDVIQAFSTSVGFIGKTQVTRVRTDTVLDWGVDCSSLTPGWTLVYNAWSPGQRVYTRTEINRSSVSGLPSPPWLFQPDIDKFRSSMLLAVGWQLIQRKQRAIDNLVSRIMSAGS